MKACFFLQRRFAYFGHTLAALLKEKYGIDEFCGYVSLRPGYNFLKSQQEIKYTKLLFEEEVYAGYKEEKIDKDYLNRLEKEYGLPNLWPYIDIDRVLRYNLLLRDYPSDQSKYSHEDLLKILQVTARKVISFLEEEKPDFIFFSIISNLGSRLLYDIARKKGIKTLVLYSSRVGNKYTVSEDYEKFQFLEEAFYELEQGGASTDEKKTALEHAHNYLKDFQKKPSYYLKASEGISELVFKSALFSDFLRFLFSPKLWRSVRWLFKSHWDYMVGDYKNDYSTIKPWVELWDKLKRKMRALFGYRNLYDQVSAGEEYAYYPLHAEPEAELVFRASWCMDQIWLIKQIARSLPIQYKIYIKDHPRMVGRRPRAYYRELKKIPNVKLLAPSASSLSLIGGSKLIFTITGTAGFEGLLLKKPVIVFADLFYNILPWVRKCESVVGLADVVKDQLENNRYDEQKIVNFIAAVSSESVDIDIVKLWAVDGSLGVLGKDKMKLMPLVDLIAKRLNLAPNHRLT